MTRPEGLDLESGPAAQRRAAPAWIADVNLVGDGTRRGVAGHQCLEDWCAHRLGRESLRPCSVRK